MPQTNEQMRDRRLDGTALAAIVRKLPANAQAAMRYFKKKAAREFDEHGAYIASVERIRQEIQRHKAKVAVNNRTIETQRRVLSPGDFTSWLASVQPDLDEATEEVTALEDELNSLRADQQRAPNDGGCYDQIRSFLTAFRNQPFRAVEPDTFIIGSDASSLVPLRADIAAKAAQLTAIDNSFVSVADTMTKVDAFLDRAFSAGRPEVFDAMRLSTIGINVGTGANLTQGSIKMPTQYIGNNTFAPAGIDFVCWAFKDEIRAKLLELVESKISSADEPIAIADRPALKASISADMLALERQECSLVWNLIDAGAIVSHRVGCDVRALLGIEPI